MQEIIPFRPSRRRETPALLVRVSCVLAAGLLAGCGGGGGGGNSGSGGAGGSAVTADQVVGTWSGTMDQTKSRAGSQLGISLQFQKGTAANTVQGTFVETAKETVGGVTQDFVQKIGTFTGTVGSTTVTLDGVLHYDANDNPDPNATLNFHADLAVTRALGLTGTWNQGTHSGALNIVQQTTSSTPSLNMGGSWIGDPTFPGSGDEGFTPTGSTTPLRFNVSFTQDKLNVLTAMTVSSPLFGTQPFNAVLGGTVGNSVTIQGILPPTTPDLAGQHIAGQKYTLAATVDPTGQKLTGVMQIYVSGIPYVAGTFKASKGGVGILLSPRLLIADRDNHRVVGIDDTTGANWTVIGTGAPGNNPQQFFHPEDVAGDKEGRIYVADTGNNRIVRVNDMKGTNWTTFGVGAANSTAPHRIAVDSNDRVYWTSAEDVFRVDDVSPTVANASTVVKLPKGDPSGPGGIAIDSQNRVYVVYPAANKIVRMNSDGSNPVSFGSTGSGVGQFNFHTGDQPSWLLSIGSIDLDSQDRIYVADNNNNRIVRINDMTGAGWTTFTTTDATGAPVMPWDVEATGSGSPIYYSDGTNEVVHINDMTGSGVSRIGTFGTGTNQFVTPRGLAYR